MITLKALMSDPQYIALIARFGELDFVTRHHAVCADGFTLSIQASDTHRSTPSGNEDAPWAKLELGYPSEIEPLLEPYSEKPGSWDTVYNYVPWEVVEQVVAKHGGIADVSRSRTKEGIMSAKETGS